MDCEGFWKTQPPIGGRTLQKDIKDKLHAILGFALDKLAYDVTVLDVTKICSYTDVIVVCHGTSTRQAQAIISNIREQMKKQGVVPFGAEGETEGQWVVLDYGDIVIHAFLKATREFYRLEEIWPDARCGSAQSNAKGVSIAWRVRRRRKADVV